MLNVCGLCGPESQAQDGSRGPANEETVARSHPSHPHGIPPTVTAYITTRFQNQKICIDAICKTPFTCQQFRPGFPSLHNPSSAWVCGVGAGMIQLPRTVLKRKLSCLSGETHCEPLMLALLHATVPRQGGCFLRGVKLTAWCLPGRRLRG